MADAEITNRARLVLAKAIDETIIRAPIPLVRLAEQAGVNPDALSQIRGGRVDVYGLDPLARIGAQLRIPMKIEIRGIPESVTKEELASLRREVHDTPDRHEAVAELKAELLSAISATMRSWNLTGGQVGERVGMPGSTVSLLRNLKADKFRLDKLVEFAPRFGLDVTLTATPA